MTTRVRVTHEGGNHAVEVLVCSNGGERVAATLIDKGQEYDDYVHSSQSLVVREVPPAATEAPE